MTLKSGSEYSSFKTTQHMNFMFPIFDNFISLENSNIVYPTLISQDFYLFEPASYGVHFSSTVTPKLEFFKFKEDFNDSFI